MDCTNDRKLSRRVEIENIAEFLIYTMCVHLGCGGICDFIRCEYFL